MLLFSLPYPSLKAIADRLTKDGDAKPFTAGLNASLHPYYGLVFALALGLGLLFLWKRPLVYSAFEKGLGWLRQGLGLLAADFWKVWNQFRRYKPAKWETFLVAILTLSAGWLRLIQINHEMGYDEAYTYIAFASKSLWTVLSDYHLPNNHVFHTLLVHFAIGMTGSGQPWAVRLPAYIAGILIVPAIYLLARQLYDRPTAILSACLTAINAFLISFSVNARGYTLLTLLSILAFWTGAYVLRHKNWFAWALLVVLSALGFFTVPVMVYPFGSLVVWLFFSGLVKDLSSEYASRKQFWVILAGMVIATGALTLLLYAPILIVSGPQKLFANQFVSGLPWSLFFKGTPRGLLSAYRDWFLSQPAWLMWVSSFTFITSLVFYRVNGRRKVPTQAAASLWIVLALLIQRPATISRVWLFLLPLYCMWSASGLVALVQLVRLPANRLWLQPAHLLSVLTLGVFFVAGYHLSVTSRLEIPLDNGAARRTMMELKTILQPGDMIVLAYPADAPLQYYAQISGLSQSYFYRPKQKNRPFQRAFLVVVPQFEQSITSVLKDEQLDPAAFDLAGLQTESDYGMYRVYRVEPAER